MASALQIVDIPTNKKDANSKWQIILFIFFFFLFLDCKDKLFVARLYKNHIDKLIYKAQFKEKSYNYKDNTSYSI